MTTTEDQAQAEPSDAVSLVDQLSAAEQTERTLSRRVSDLFRDMQASATAGDYAQAGKVQATLNKARSEHEAATAALRDLQVKIESLDAESAKRVAAERGQRRHAELMGQARAATTEADQHLAKVFPLVSQVRQELQAAAASERQAGQLLRDALGALIAGGQDVRLMFDVDRVYGAPRRVAEAIDRDPLLKTILNGRIL